MQKEYNVVSKKEFIIYSILPVIHTIIILYFIFIPPLIIEYVIETILLILMFYIAPILGWIINIIFNFGKTDNKKVKLITKILFNISAILYTALITFLMLVVLALFSSDWGR